MITQDPEYYGLIPGKIYAIQPVDTIHHHAGTFRGYVDFVDERHMWLAFEVGHGIRFYNPDHIRSLLAEERP